MWMVLALVLGCGEGVQTQREACEAYEQVGCDCGDNAKSACAPDQIEQSMNYWCGGSSTDELDANRSDFERCLQNEYSDTCDESSIYDVCCAEHSGLDVCEGI